MDPKRVIEIIRSNGAMGDIRCFLYSRIYAHAEPDFTFIKHYEYSNCQIKIKRSDDGILNKHEKNFGKYRFCEFRINKGEKSKLISILFDCVCEKISKKFISIKILKVNYDDHGEKASYSFSE